MSALKIVRKSVNMTQFAFAGMIGMSVRQYNRIEKSWKEGIPARLQPWFQWRCCPECDARIRPIDLQPVGSRPSQHESECYADSSNLEQHRANARLVAAAPDLLEAMKELRDAFSSAVPPSAMRDAWRPAWIAANAAIATAEGK